MKKLMVVLWLIWNLRSWGVSRRVKYLELISLVDLFVSIDIVIILSVIYVVNVLSDEIVNVYGVCFCFKLVYCVVKKVFRIKVEFIL